MSLRVYIPVEFLRTKGEIFNNDPTTISFCYILKVVCPQFLNDTIYKWTILTQTFKST